MRRVKTPARGNFLSHKQSSGTSIADAGKPAGAIIYPINKLEAPLDTRFSISLQSQHLLLNFMLNRRPN
jgi:hypothetical protein